MSIESGRKVSGPTSTLHLDPLLNIITLSPPLTPLRLPTAGQSLILLTLSQTMLTRECPCPITSQIHSPGSLPCGGLHSPPYSPEAPLQEGFQPTVTSLLAQLRPHHFPHPTGPPWPLQTLSPSHTTVSFPQSMGPITYSLLLLLVLCLLPLGHECPGGRGSHFVHHIPLTAAQVQDACSLWVAGDDNGPRKHIWADEDELQMQKALHQGF